MHLHRTTPTIPPDKIRPPNSKKQSHFQQQIEKLNDLFERRLQQFIGDAANKHQMEMDEIDERKSNQIVRLIEKHESAFADMQNYYDDIVQSNLELIESLKKQMQALAEQLEKSEQRLKKVRVGWRLSAMHSCR